MNDFIISKLQISVQNHQKVFWFEFIEIKAIFIKINEKNAFKIQSKLDIVTEKIGKTKMLKLKQKC